MYRGIVKEATEHQQQQAHTPLRRINWAERWLQADLLQIGIWGFAVSNVWALSTAVGLNYGYQDTWILEGVWQPLVLALCFYIVTVYKDLDPERTAILTAFFVFTVYSVSVLKYTYIYASTIDASIHFSMMRSLAEVGRFDNNIYAYTPGLHLLVGSLAQLSGMSVAFWAKIVPAFMGSIIPMGVYLLCSRIDMPRLLLRCIIILSGLSLPMLYLPNGTTFAILIISPLVTMVILQSISEPRMRLGFMVMMYVLGATLIIWHAASSLVIPLTFAMMGSIGLLFVWLWERVAYLQIWIRRPAFALVIMGTIGFVSTLLYWRFVATPIWEQLMDNMRVFTQVVETQKPSEGILVPERAFTLQPIDLILTLLVNHARDGGMLALVGLGGIFNLYALLSTWRSLSSRDRYVQIVRLFIIICALFCVILVTTLVTGFAKLGYKRYLLYVMAVSAPIAGYGLWKAVTLLNERLPRISPHAVVASTVALAFLVATIQLFPHQSMVPRAKMPGTDGSTPLFWQHQVNSEYQRFGIDFAATQIDADFNVFTDYRTYHQAGIFLDLAAKHHFHYGSWPTPRPSYLLYHIPGPAGAYSEQAEYRSVEAIQERRDLEGVNTVYDNGGTFLMFVPERQLEKTYLEFTGNE